MEQTPPYEFEVANKFGILARIDNHSVKGLRLGLSGYFGQAMHNTFPHDLESPTSKYRDVKGNVRLVAFDFSYNSRNLIARGSVDYGYISDSKTINDLKANQSSGSSPYRKSAFGSHAVATSVEAGYNILSFTKSQEKLFLFGHYEYYDSFVGSINKYTTKQVFAFGLNYFPLPQIAVKAEYNYRKLLAPFNDEPSLNLCVCYQGFFR